MGLIVSCMAWPNYEDNNGPPMPLSDGAFGMAFSPDGRTVAAVNPNLEIWSVADPARPRRLGYSKGDTADAPTAFSPDGAPQSEWSAFIISPCRATDATAVPGAVHRASRTMLRAAVVPRAQQGDYGFHGCDGRRPGHGVSPRAAVSIGTMPGPRFVTSGQWKNAHRGLRSAEG